MKKAFRKIIGMGCAFVILAASTGVVSPVQVAAKTAEKPYEVSVLSITYTGEPISDNAPTKLALEKHTNAKINFTWVADSNYEDKLNVMMASGSLPTLVVLKGLTASVITNAKAGAFWDITKEIPKYENLKQTNPIVLNNISIDGKIYGVPRTRTLGRNGITFRKDWLQNVGLSEPKTIDDIYKTLKAFTENDPDKNGKKDTYGMTWCKWYGPLDIIATWFGAGNGWDAAKDGTVSPVFLSKEYMDAMKWSKKLYDEGLVNEDFAVRDSAIWGDDFKASKSGVHIDVADQATRYQAELDKLDKKDTVWVIGSVEGPKGVRNLPTTGHAGIVAISRSGAKKQADLDKALAFIDKTNDTEAINMLTYGLPDRDFKIVNGKVERVEEAVAKITTENEGFNQFMTDVAGRMTPEKMIPIRQQVWDVQNKINPSICVENPCQPLMASSKVYSEKGSQIDKIWQDARVKFIVGQIDEAGYNAEMELWKKQGGNDLTKELSDMYKKSTGK